MYKSQCYYFESKCELFYEKNEALSKSIILRKLLKIEESNDILRLHLVLATDFSSVLFSLKY